MLQAVATVAILCDLVSVELQAVCGNDKPATTTLKMLKSRAICSLLVQSRNAVEFAGDSMTAMKGSATCGHGMTLIPKTICTSMQSRPAWKETKNV